jgi:hypothetical protein
VAFDDLARHRQADARPLVLLPRHQALEDLDEEVLAGLLAAAAPEVRARVEQRVRDTIEDARRRGAGVDARTDLEAAERRAAATEECGYRNLLEAALEQARKGTAGRTA